MTFRDVCRHSLTRFLGLAAVGFAFDLTLLNVLDTYTEMSTAVAVSVAFWVTYMINFGLNRSLAFGADRKAVGPQLVRFVPQVLGDYVLTVAGVLLLQQAGLGLTVSRVLAAGTNLVFNYVLYRWWTFRKIRAAPDPERVPA